VGEPRSPLAEKLSGFRTTNQTKTPNRTKIPTPIVIPTPRPIFAPDDRPDDDGDVAADAATIVVAITAADEPDSLIVAEDFSDSAVIDVEGVATSGEVDSPVRAEEVVMVEAMEVEALSDDDATVVDREVGRIVVYATPLSSPAPNRKT